MPFKEKLHSSSIYAMGFGIVHFNATKGSNILQYAKLNHDDCSKFSEFYSRYDEEKQFCAGGESRNFFDIVKFFI